LGRGKNYPGVAEDSDKRDDSSDDSFPGRHRSSCGISARSTEYVLDKMPSLPKSPNSTEIRVWFRQVVIMFGNNERKTLLMKSSPRKEVRDKGAMLSLANPSELIKQAKRAGLPSELIQNLLDQAGSTPARNRLISGSGKQWKHMTRSGFAMFARSPDEDFNICMAIMEQLVGLSNGGEDLEDAELGGGLTMAEFVKHSKTKAVRQVLLHKDPRKWTVRLYRMKFDIVAAAVYYKKGFTDTTQDARDMFIAKVISGLLGPLKKKAQEKKRAVEVKFREDFMETKKWSISEFWKLVARVEEQFVKVEQSLSYPKYANEKQTVTVGSKSFEWGREADFRKSNKLMGKDISVPKSDIMWRMKTGRTSHCKKDWIITINTLIYSRHTIIKRSMCGCSQGSTIVLCAELFIGDKIGRAERGTNSRELLVQKLQE